MQMIEMIKVFFEHIIYMGIYWKNFWGPNLIN